MTELDKELLNIANNDWQGFIALIGTDAIVSAKICILRKNKLSYGQIKHKLNVSKSRIEYACSKCPPKP